MRLGKVPSGYSERTAIAGAFESDRSYSVVVVADAPARQEVAWESVVFQPGDLREGYVRSGGSELTEGEFNALCDLDGT